MNHRESAPHTPRVVVLGPTGCGKSVQAELLASKYGLVNGKRMIHILMCYLLSLEIKSEKTVQGLVIQRIDNAIRRINHMHYTLIHWIAIYLPTNW